MNPITITCPRCNKVFELTAAIEQPIMESVRKEIAAAEAKKAEEAVQSQLRDLTTQIGEQKKKLKEAEQAEFQFLQQKRELQQQREAFELEKARQMDIERQHIRDEARKTALASAALQLRQLQEQIASRDEEYRLKEAEKNKQLEDMKRQIDDLRRKAEQGSQQLQGEVLELDLERAAAVLRRRRHHAGSQRRARRRSAPSGAG